MAGRGLHSRIPHSHHFTLFFFHKAGEVKAIGMLGRQFVVFRGKVIQGTDASPY